MRARWADALLAALPVAVIVLDDAGCIASVNVATEVLLNSSAAHLRHKPLGVVLRLPPECLAGLRGDAPFAAYDCRAESGRLRLRIDVHGTGLAEQPGWKLIVLVGSNGAQRLERRGSHAAIGAAAMLAHEIKNPLSGIRGAAQLVEAQLGPEDRALTQLICGEVDRIARLIDRMEQFTDDRPAERAPENVHAVLDDARALALAGFARGVDIRTVYDPSLPLVLVDRDALVQIVTNLLKNAVEAGPSDAGRVITLTTGYRQGVSTAASGVRRALPIEVCVVDNGAGPPPEIADQMFEPFVSSKASARGLGLALVDKLVRDNGGIVQFAREGEPEQSVVRVLLARAA